MPLAEFEEKAFEGPLNAQLLAGSNLLFTPGQVLEYKLGFDAAMFTRNATFWALWGGQPRSGTIALPQLWSGLAPANSAPPKSTPSPGFPLNVFLQYKRPAYLTRPPALEWSAWNSPYYRYEPPAEQRAILARLSRRLGRRGLVLFAAPAFATWRELFNFTIGGELVARTNFVRASRVARHETYTFRDPGRFGKAFSTPTEIPSVNVMTELPSLIDAAMSAAEHDESPFQSADAATTAVMEQEHWPDEWSLHRDLCPTGRREYHEIGTLAESVARQVVHEFPDVPPHDVKRFVRVAGFCWLTGTGLLMAGR